MKTRNIFLLLSTLALSSFALAQPLTLNAHTKSVLKDGTEIICRAGGQAFQKTLKGAEINPQQSFRLGVIKHNCKEGGQVSITCSVKLPGQGGVAKSTYVTCQELKNPADIDLGISLNNNRYHLDYRVGGKAR